MAVKKVSKLFKLDQVERLRIDSCTLLGARMDIALDLEAEAEEERQRVEALKKEEAERRAEALRQKKKEVCLAIAVCLQMASAFGKKQSHCSHWLPSPLCQLRAKKLAEKKEFEDALRARVGDKLFKWWQGLPPMRQRRQIEDWDREEQERKVQLLYSKLQLLDPADPNPPPIPPDRGQRQRQLAKHGKQQS